MQQYNFLQQKAIQYPRLAGVLTILLGLLLFYVGFLEPYWQVNSQAPEVNFYLAPTILGIPVVLIGLNFIVFGNRFSSILFKPVGQNSKKQLHVFYALVMAITVVVIWLLQRWAETKGYIFQ